MTASAYCVCVFFLSSISSVVALPSDSSVTFADVTLASSIDFKHTDGESGLRFFNEQYGSGGGFFDYDNDGDLDVYLVNGASQVKTDNPLSTNALYQNDGKGKFTNVTTSSGMGHTGYGVGCAVGDYDNDGDLDLYVTNFGPNVLYRNNGNGNFTDVSQSAKVASSLWGTSCAFADVDNDGFLDLYIATYANYAVEKDKRCYKGNVWVYCGPDAFSPSRDVFYHNNQDGTFSDLTREMGFLAVTPNHGLALAFGDYDNDGDIDLYVANDRDANFLFQNRGDGTFEEVGLLSGVSHNDLGMEEAGMGAAFGDYDNDGTLDLTVSNFQRETNTLYRNEGEGFFGDVTIQAGIARVTYTTLGWGIAFLDYDNDGYKDIFVANGHVLDNIAELESSTTCPQRNLLLRNLGNGTYADVTEHAGPGLALRKASRAAAFGDYDNDGDIDILVTNWNQTPDLLRNDGGNQNHWIQIRAVGTQGNRSGIGAKIKVVADGLTQYGEVHSGGSYLAFSDLCVHFGLAKSDVVDRVEIRWPSGQTDTAKNLAVNRRYVAIEGEGLKGDERR